MSATPVLYVHRRDAKTIKSHLEDLRIIDKRFRMAPTTSDAIIHDDTRVNDGALPSRSHQDDVKADIQSGRCIAVPVVSLSFFDKLHEYPWAAHIVGSGVHFCSFSTSVGNTNRSITSYIVDPRTTAEETSCTQITHRGNALPPVNDVQYALIETLVSHQLQSINEIERESAKKKWRTSITSSVLALSAHTCPKKLEVIGDDRTLVVPRWALYLINNSDCDIGKQKGGNELHQLLMQYIRNSESKHAEIEKIQSALWENLARIHRSPRVVRRGDIDPESGVRESGHRILWPRSLSCESGDCNIGFMPSTTGEGSPNWITITEHKIAQSFDLTRVMFSRGNVTEKKRFASLVQPGEHVLDMYAGIGYYTLPALIHGKADHVTACEWNPYALFALRYNLKANGVEHKATVLEGDCRLSLRGLLERFNNNSAEHKYFDRVSLGLLPSSEGGWDVAVACLNQVTGGWLHVHGNVPCAERQNWSHWVCQTIKHLTAKYNHPEEWHAICIHVEKVKSFAPKVDHVVADVFVGPLSSPKTPLKDGFCSTGVIDSFGAFHGTKIGEITPPSCALNKQGILHQDWLILHGSSYYCVHEGPPL